MKCNLNIHFDSFNDFYGHFKTSLMHKKTEFSIKKETNRLKIVDLFYKQGLISNYTVQNNNIIVYLKQYQANNIINDIKNISGPGRPFHCKNHVLKKTFATHSQVVMSTNKGLIFRKNSSATNTGGILLYKLN